MPSINLFAFNFKEKFMLQFFFVAALFCLISTFGCVSKESLLAPLLNSVLSPVKNPSMAWVQNQKKLEAIHAWTIQGEVGISDGVSAKSINVTWVENNANYEIDFYGPLEIKIGSLVKNSEGVFLKTSDQKLKADDPENLMYEEFGWSLPIQGLSDWIRGLPSSSRAVRQNLNLNLFGYVAKLRDQGWDITYLNYKPVGVNISGNLTGVALPTRMILKQGNIRLVIVIQAWDLN